jgi:hypothetical protein
MITNTFVVRRVAKFTADALVAFAVVLVFNFPCFESSESESRGRSHSSLSDGGNFEVQLSGHLCFSFSANELVQALPELL